MTEKFEVKLRTETYTGEYDNLYHVLEDVTPIALSTHCPHCGVYASFILDTTLKRKNWNFDRICSCPKCCQTIFAKAEYSEEKDEASLDLIYPNKPVVNLPLEIPTKHSEDYREAILIQEDSPKASAALCRRILQSILRDEFGIHRRNLVQEIEEFIILPNIPSYLADAIDAVRNVGNFAAHPAKDLSTGEILDVEPGEAEWLIEVIGSLCDFVFVQPIKLRRRKDALNSKLKDVGKPPMKDLNKPPLGEKVHENN